MRSDVETEDAREVEFDIVPENPYGQRSPEPRAPRDRGLFGDLRARLLRPWPRPALVAVTAVATCLLTVAAVRSGEEGPDRAVPAPAASQPPLRPDVERELRARAMAALPAHADGYGSVPALAPLDFPDITAGHYLLDVACASTTVGVAVDLVATSLPSGTWQRVTVEADGAVVEVEVDVAEGGGLRLSPVDSAGTACEFAMRLD
ncbi:hypothetical protein AB0I28_09230 [Phytomonospora sp. NPDC050363]|uniref:hypothetical protein n=1 Tax=Phytomonospora sp. NPDC050363 TaxID=3155642 RepID=UPI0033C4D24C